MDRRVWDALFILVLASVICWCDAKASPQSDPDGFREELINQTSVPLTASEGMRKLSPSKKNSKEDDKVARSKTKAFFTIDKELEETEIPNVGPAKLFAMISKLFHSIGSYLAQFWAATSKFWGFAAGGSKEGGDNGS